MWEARWERNIQEEPIFFERWGHEKGVSLRVSGTWGGLVEIKKCSSHDVWYDKLQCRNEWKEIRIVKVIDNRGCKSIVPKPTD